jgi:hypothetical protein
MGEEEDGGMATMDHGRGYDSGVKELRSMGDGASFFSSSSSSSSSSFLPPPFPTILPYF